MIYTLKPLTFSLTANQIVFQIEPCADVICSAAARMIRRREDEIGGGVRRRV
jgi:hypothetical protein